jgi:hypothetical protein
LIKAAVLHELGNTPRYENLSDPVAGEGEVVVQVPYNYDPEQTRCDTGEGLSPDAPLGLRVDETSPWVDARLPNGSRVHAIVPSHFCGPILTQRPVRERRDRPTVSTFGQLSRRVTASSTPIPSDG